MAKSVLGRGLGALIQARTSAGAGARPAAIPAAAAPPAPGEIVLRLSLDQIHSSPFQPRQDFKPESLTELVDSIRERGIIQPLIVRQAAGGHFELIAGARRWRAARMVGLIEAPAIVREASDREVLEIALIENIQRADLNVIEEARAYERLALEFGLRQEDISQKVGKSRAAVANAMRLLDLDGQVQRWLMEDRLSVGHAKVLLGVRNQDEQKTLAEHIIRQRSTVRASERLIQDHNERLGNSQSGPGSRTGPGGRKGADLPPILHQWQNRLRDRLATHVAMRHTEKKGTIEIEYYGNDDLRRILGELGVATDD